MPRHCPDSAPTERKTGSQRMTILCVLYRDYFVVRAMSCVPCRACHVVRAISCCLSGQPLRLPKLHLLPRPRLRSLPLPAFPKIVSSTYPCPSLKGRVKTTNQSLAVPNLPQNKNRETLAFFVRFYSTLVHLVVHFCFKNWLKLIRDFYYS